jgi:dipeptide transport system ATP-binding protein
MPLLDIAGLHVDFPSHQGVLHAVDDLSLQLEAGEVLGIVGESGSGKSVSMMALMGLIPFPGRVSAKHLRFAGQDILAASEATRRSIVGKDIAMIFQDPMTSLNPCFTVEFQITESLRLHKGMTHKQARMRACELLDQVGIADPAKRLSAYPHQLSGGMSQRVMIAMAIACQPRLLIADEPTTALDVTVQAQILDLLATLQKEQGMAMVLISHNMGVVSEVAQRVAVMYAGQVVELQNADRIFDAPEHPYTQALLQAMPERSSGQARLHTIAGMVPGMLDRPPGCLFAPRCSHAQSACVTPAPVHVASGLQVRCHLFASNLEERLV